MYIEWIKNAYPWHLLYFQFFEGKKNHGRQQLRYKYVAKRNMKWREK